MRRPISRARQEELKAEAEAMFIPEDAENPFEYLNKHECGFCGNKFATSEILRQHESHCKPKLPCHVPNCQSPECDRFHPGDDE